jgi:hypothetical protein
VPYRGLIYRLFRPSPGIRFGLLAILGNKDDAAVGLSAAVAAHPGDPVRAARFAVNLVRAGGGGRHGLRIYQIQADFAKIWPF